MGLDTVELVIEVEKEFRISIPDADAELIQTVGHLHAYVCHTLRPRGQTVCPSARAFYHFRRVLHEHHPVPRQHVRPSARIARLIPEECRHRWPAVAEGIGLSKTYSFNGRADVRFPAVYTTVRDLVRRMTFPTPARWPPLHGAFEEEVWQKVLQIVSEQAGVAPSEIGPETHFINDLCLD